MKRLLVALIVLLPLSWFVAGCGGSGSSSGPSVNPPPKDQQDAMMKAQKEMMEKSAQPPK